MYDSARNPFREGAGQEDRAARRITGPSEAAHGDPIGDALLVLGFHPARGSNGFGLGGFRRDSVDTDSMRAEFQGQAFRKPLDGQLEGRIGHDIGEPAVALDGRNTDDAAAFTRSLHQGDGFPRTDHHVAQEHAEEIVDVLVGHLFQGFEEAKRMADVVDQDIEPSLFGFHPLNQRSNGGRIADVAFHGIDGKAPAARFIVASAHGLRVRVRHQDPGPQLGETLRDASPDATGAPGDQGDFSLQRNRLHASSLVFSLNGAK